MRSAGRLRGAALALCCGLLWCAHAQEARDLFVTVGKSLVVESPVQIQRVAVGDIKIAEAFAVSPREVVVNGKTPGETTLIVWQQGGNRLLFDLRVRTSTTRLEAVREELRKELPGQDVSINQEGENVFVRGTVADMLTADRVVAIAKSLGEPVNLLNVRVPDVEQQILLKVRFANVERSAIRELGANLFSTGALNTIGSVTTGQFRPPAFDFSDPNRTAVTLSEALNVFLFRRDLNLGATIRALQNRRLLEILAEPNVLALNGRQASFLAGGEVPVPVIQSGVGGVGAVTIQWREFGIRLSFTPLMTPRGTVRLKVAPEVSSLDPANGVTISGVNVPALSTRKVQTEIELEAGQSFAIAGLLDNRAIENLSKVPGLGDIPLLGRLFQSKAISRSTSELLVVVTPELVRPIPEGQPLPELKMPVPFLEGGPAAAPQTPGLAVTGPVPVKAPVETVPYQQLRALQQQMRDQPAAVQQTSPQLLQLVPVPVVTQPDAPAQPAPPAAAPPK